VRDKMRITLVMASAEDGGLEKHVIELANGLSRQHAVSLIAHPRFLNNIDEKVNFIAMDMSGNRHNPWLKYKLKNKIKETSPDVVHAHASKTAQLMQGMVKKLSAPCLVTIHGVKSNINPYLAFDHIIAVSQRLAEALSAPLKTSVVYNGVNNDASKEMPFAENRKFIAIGRLNEVKGFDILLRAWAELPYHLTIAGEGDQRPYLEALIHELKLSGRINLIGHSADIQSLILQHEALIVSSLREGGPYTLGEALLLKRPVIGTDVGVMSEFIDLDLLCEAGNAAALKRVIEHYIALENPIEKFQRSFQLAQEQLSFDKMIKSTVNVYTQCLNQGKFS